MKPDNMRGTFCHSIFDGLAIAGRQGLTDNRRFFVDHCKMAGCDFGTKATTHTIVRIQQNEAINRTCCFIVCRKILGLNKPGGDIAHQKNGQGGQNPADDHKFWAEKFAFSNQHGNFDHCPGGQNYDNIGNAGSFAKQHFTDWKGGVNGTGRKTTQ